MNKYEKSFNYLKEQLKKRYNINEIHPNLINECIEYDKVEKALNRLEKLVVRAIPRDSDDNRCPKCNRRINDKDNFCSSCGQAIDREIDRDIYDYPYDEDYIL